MEEIWKTIDWIPNLRGTYEVSNLGNVRRTSMIWYDNQKQTYRTIYKTKNLRKYNNGHGYVHVTFPLNTGTGSKYKNFYIHKLVAIAFIPNPLNKPEINHKNFVRADNMATNLEWCTHEENDAHKMSMDKRLKPKYPSGCRKEQKQTQKDNKKKLSKPSNSLKSLKVSNPILLSYRSSKNPCKNETYILSMENIQ